jgi:uncharacterized membrane protein
MFAALQRVFRHAVYELRDGFLVRPLSVGVAIGAFGIALPLVSDALPGLDAWAERLPEVVPRDPAAAKGVFASILSAMMTVVSIVLSVLLVAITFASVQFSPRILTAFVEDRTSQRTIGVFLGTFMYCLFAYSSARSDPPRTPALSALGAMCLALACIVALVVFVHHIARAVNVNFATERIAGETERTIDAMTSKSRASADSRGRQPRPRLEGPVVRVTRSGYIRYVDTKHLRSVATRAGIVVSLERRVGHFVPEGAAVARLSEARNIEGLHGEILDTIDLGPVRTMEQDIEFGLLQLVDIALKALSPGVNDPSTAINCVDQLDRLLVKLASREPISTTFCDAAGVVRVVLPEVPFARLLRVAFDQIVHYGKSDLAVALRLQRAFSDIGASTGDPEVLEAVRAAAEHAAEVTSAVLPGAGERAVTERLAAVRGPIR